jgi:PAS domain S-box-containing protein
MNSNFSYTPSLIETILDNTEDGIILFSPYRNHEGQITDLRYLFINHAGEKIIGKKREDIIGKGLLEVFPDHSSTGLFRAYRNVLESGDALKTERYYADDGFSNWFKISAIRMDEKLLVNFNDITDYKKMIAQKARNENLYRTLIRSLPHADVALIAKDMQVMLVDGRPLRAFSFDKTLVEQEILNKQLPSEVFSKLLPILKACLEGKGRRLEMEMAGNLFRLSFLPVRDENSVIFCVLLVSEDIGIFNSKKNDLRNKIYELESANQSLEQFAYVASHDLQEPLRKIRAFGDRLQSKYRDVLDESAQDYIDRMQNAAQRMQKLIDDLLKYSRVGRIQESYRTVDMNDILQNVLLDLEEAIEESKAEVSVGDLPSLKIDPGLMQQLFLNLISNAIKFRKEGIPPKIIVKVEEVQKDTTTDTNQAFYRFYVKDNGIGFDEKYLDKIFNIFQRLHGRHEYAGTGIGLAICRKIAENHGGSIFASSSPGNGATFMVDLPKTQDLITS